MVYRFSIIFLSFSQDTYWNARPVPFELMEGLYFTDPIIRKFLKDIGKNGKEVFRHLEYHKIDKINNVSEHHFSIGLDLLKLRFKNKKKILSIC